MHFLGSLECAKTDRAVEFFRKTLWQCRERRPNQSLWRAHIMHKHAVEADMVDVFAVDFEVVDGLTTAKLLDSR